MDQPLYGDSGWVLWGSSTIDYVWHWYPVKVWNQIQNMQFTMDAGTYTMKISVREDETQLDVIVITRVDD